MHWGMSGSEGTQWPAGLLVSSESSYGCKAIGAIRGNWVLSGGVGVSGMHLGQAGSVGTQLPAGY